MNDLSGPQGPAQHGFRRHAMLVSAVKFPVSLPGTLGGQLLPVLSAGGHHPARFVEGVGGTVVFRHTASVPLTGMSHTAEIVLAHLMGGLLEAPTAQVAFHRRLGHPDHLPAAGQTGRRQN